MNKYKSLITVIILIIIFTGSILLITNQKKSAPLYVEEQNNTQGRISNDSMVNDSRQNAITKTVQLVSPAVVGINVTEIREYSSPFNPFFNDPFFRQFFGGNGNWSQKVKELGSGFIISPDGYIVTNDHVAGNGTDITVTLTNGKEYKAKLVGTDHSTDISLLKIDDTNLPHVILGNSNDVLIGEWVIAFGNPFGLFNLNDKPTVTVGVISSTGMNLEQIHKRYYLNMLQTDAAINAGNSGGPLVNSIGEVIGMNTLIFTGNGTNGNIGLGFAIPINRIKRIITQLKKYGKVNRDFDVGLKIQAVDKGIANYYHLQSTRGVIVIQVLSGSPAAKAGIKEGDIILQVDDYLINDEDTLIGVFQQYSVGDVLTIKILRDNKIITTKMKLEKTS